jgi:hypothetical protein
VVLQASKAGQGSEALPSTGLVFRARLHVLERSLVANKDWEWTCATTTLL